MHDLKPHLDKLSEKHKKDRKKLQQEQMKLYQEAGINPLSGCLFMIIQMPIFIGLYQTLSLFFTKDPLQVINEINNVIYASFLRINTIDPWFFGLNLALTPAKSGAWYYYLIPVITAVLQYYQVVVSTPQQQNQTITKSTGEKNNQEDFQKAMNTQMKFMFPLLIGWFSFSFPVGLSLYWNIFSIFSIMQSKHVFSSVVKSAVATAALVKSEDQKK